MTARALHEDAFLDGRVRLVQPETGYRAGSDSVFLAAAVPARAGEQVLDIGCGTGAVALCLAVRVPGVAVDGLELQSELAAVADGNVTLNGCDDRVRIVPGDLLQPPASLPRNAYHHVVTNPPYLEAGQATPPPDPSKARAFLTEGLSLRDWLERALRFVRPMGWLHLVQRTDRLPDIIAALDGRAGDIAICPLWPRQGETARRVVLRARKGGRGPAKLHPGLVLHGPDGQYTAAADAILRDGAPLVF